MNLPGRWLIFFALLLFAGFCSAEPVAHLPGVSIRLVASHNLPEVLTRLAHEPGTSNLFYLTANGAVYRLDLNLPNPQPSRAYSSLEHGISAHAYGMAFGPDRSLYVVGNYDTNNGDHTVGLVMKGALQQDGTRSWSVLVRTEPYLKSKTYFDHRLSGIVIDQEGRFAFLNSGSRTDHGELHRGEREIPLTAAVFRIPTSSSNLLLLNNSAFLRTNGYLFAEGLRNSFDLAFGPKGRLFGTENGPDRDMPEEINWLREGHHYGFPWTMGGLPNPNLQPGYQRTNDPFLSPLASAYAFYFYDPTFPPVPPVLTPPLVNVGPDADRFRDADGVVKDASELGRTLSTLTSHRSPLGLVFDNAGRMSGSFKGSGFVLAWTGNDSPMLSRMGDRGEDLCQLELEELGGTNYQVRVTKVASGFRSPIDAEIIGNRVYVCEYQDQRGIWEITFPAAVAEPLLAQPGFTNGLFQFELLGQPGRSHEISVTTNLTNWSVLTNVVPNQPATKVIDPEPSASRKFYRARVSQ